jgi:hypothetical protein
LGNPDVAATTAALGWLRVPFRRQVKKNGIQRRWGWMKLWGGSSDRMRLGTEMAEMLSKRKRMGGLHVTLI